MLERMEEQPEEFGEIILGDPDAEDPDPDGIRGPADAAPEPICGVCSSSDDEAGEARFIERAVDEDAGAGPGDGPASDMEVNAEEELDPTELDAVLDDSPRPSAVDPVASSRQVTVVDPLATCDSYHGPADGGLVIRHGEIIGRLKDLKGRLAVTCTMHMCGTVMARGTTTEGAARWIASGREVPKGASDATRLALKQEHMAIPFPNGWEVWYRH